MKTPSAVPQINKRKPQEIDEASTKQKRTLARPGLLLILIPPLALVTIFFVVPGLRLLWLSFFTPEPGLQNYSTIATSPIVGTVILRTLMMAVIVTITTVFIAYPYAYLMTIASPRWRAVLTGIVLIPLWTSLMARTFAWIVLLQQGGLVSRFFEFLGFGPVNLLGTETGVIIAMAQVMLPFVVLPVYTNLRSIDNRLIRAAQSLGATPVTSFFRVYLPLSFPGVAAGATLVLVLSLGFYVTPALIGSPQHSMLAQFISVQVTQLVNFGAAGALAVVLLLVTFLLIGGIQLATRTKASRLIAGGNL